MGFRRDPPEAKRAGQIVPTRGRGLAQALKGDKCLPRCTNADSPAAERGRRRAVENSTLPMREARFGRRPQRLHAVCRCGFICAHCAPPCGRGRGAAGGARAAELRAAPRSAPAGERAADRVASWLLRRRRAAAGPRRRPIRNGDASDPRGLRAHRALPLIGAEARGIFLGIAPPAAAPAPERPVGSGPRAQGSPEPRRPSPLPSR